MNLYRVYCPYPPSESSNLVVSVNVLANSTAEALEIVSMSYRNDFACNFYQVDVELMDEFPPPMIISVKFASNYEFKHK